MRSLVIGTVAVAWLASFATPSNAEEWPWCAILTMGKDDQATNCGFANRQQCEAYIDGIGGYCERNPHYNPARQRQRSQSNR